MLNGKTMIILLTVGLTKNILLYKMSYLPEPHTHSKHKIKAELDLSNYAKKSVFKKATGVDSSDFAKNVDVDKLDIDKLKEYNK